MPAHAQQPSRVSEGIRGGRWVHVAAIATWLVSGFAQVVQITGGAAPWSPAVMFITAYLLYGMALLALLYLPERWMCLWGWHVIPVLLLVVESVCGMTMLHVSGHYLGGTGATAATIVIVAAQLPYVMSASWAWAYVGMQTVVLSLLFLEGGPLQDVISFALAIGGFQAFATASSMLSLSATAARERLAAANAELRAAQTLLAETSRAEERLRISRDLHDTLGHHLTALSLQLDVASRLSEGKAADHIRQAHAITRLLLSEVRDVVSTLRETRVVDLAQAVRALADTGSGLAIHLDMPPAMDVQDTERAQALLRCVQEIVTNAARHAHARNLWIRMELRSDGIALHARDDGQGAPQLSLGHGLTGMRERFAAFAGSVEFESRPETGFEIRGFMPTPHAAS